MKVKDVLLKYHEKVPFPWTPHKIRKAGLDPTTILIELGSKLEHCEDIDTEAGRSVVDMVKRLKLLG